MNITTSFGQLVQITETPNGLSVSRRELLFSRDGSLPTEFWYLDDKLHRDDGPAEIWYYDDGSVQSKTWYRDGKVHRDDGPAYIRYRYGKVFPGDTRTIEELERDGATYRAHWVRDGEGVKRFT